MSSPPVKERFITQAHLARYCGGASTQTIRRLTASGVLRRDTSSGLYPEWASTVAYWEYRLGKAPRTDEQALDYEAERARLTKAQADRAELKRDRESRELVEAKAAQRALECVLVPIRKYFLAQPERVAPLLVGLDAQGIEDKIAQENERELRRLARPVLEFGDDQPDPDLDLDGLEVLDPLAGQPEPSPAEGFDAGAEEPGAPAEDELP